jgi:cell division septum initiation protein DivIVA
MAKELDFNDVAYGSKAAMKEIQDLRRKVKQLETELAHVTEEREYYKAKLSVKEKLKTCRNCGEHITRRAMVGFRENEPWVHIRSGSPCCERPVWYALPQEEEAKP